MSAILKKYKLIIIAAVLYAAFFFIKKEIFFSAVENTRRFIVEMLQVMPPVLVISALITVWIPGDIIRKGLGQNSGLRGRVLSLLIGSISAGPIYAAFPAVLVLYKKGAGIANMVIILSAWAVVKIPMLLVEASFLGLRFVLIRVALTVPAIFILAVLSEKIISRGDVKPGSNNTIDTSRDILTDLPRLDCGGCGYKNCKLFAEAVFNNERVIKDCVILKKRAVYAASADA